MTIGEKNRYLTINVPGTTLDAANQPIGWVFFKNKWAQALAQTGIGRIRAEANAGGISTDLQRVSFRVSFDMTLVKGMQIVDPLGTTYEVQSVNHDVATRQHTDLVCQTGGVNA